MARKKAEKTTTIKTAEMYIKENWLKWMSQRGLDEDGVWEKAHLDKALSTYSMGRVPDSNGGTLPVSGKCPGCKLDTDLTSFHCWLCQFEIRKPPRGEIALMQGTGKHMLSTKRWNDAKDYWNKNQADGLQPYQYEKNGSAGGKIVKNPDFVKVYGDPEKIG